MWSGGKENHVASKLAGSQEAKNAGGDLKEGGVQGNIIHTTLLNKKVVGWRL